MHTEEINGAKTLDEAADEILRWLKENTNASRSVSSRNNVFYFNGWDGLGASAVLRAIAERFTPTSPAGKRALAEQEFDKLIHIDCSLWESRRALQKAVAEQLRLSDEVMELFDREDEADDFKGVAQDSRTEIQQVTREMYQHVQNKNNGFLVIFHNGSSEEIDLANLCGFRLSGFATNKVLWTFQGRFRHRPRVKVDMAMNSTGTTDTFLLVVLQPFGLEQDQLGDFWPYLVSQQASELVAAHKINTGPHSTFNQPAQVHECFLYMLELCCRSSHSIDYDLTTHIAMNWVCDDIIHQGQRDGISADGDDDRLWRAAEALQREMQLDVDYHQYSPSSPLAKFVKSKPYWTSPTCGFTWIPAEAIPNRDMFQRYCDKLHVLKLSRCTFDFQSPPFICCHGLRFLWLHHCKGTRANTDVAEKERDVGRCFQMLWVLDVRYTNCDQILSAQMLDLMTQLRELNVIGTEVWDIGQLWGRLPNIRKLRVKNSMLSCSRSENNLFAEMNKMVLLDFSGNRDIYRMKSLSGQRVGGDNKCLETVIIVDGCVLQQIYFRGCTKLKILHLRGLMAEVRSLDISGTAVKILDLSTTYINNLEELYLLGCEKLCAILWPSKDKMKQIGLSMLCVDTTQQTPTAQPSKEKAKRGTTTGTSVICGSLVIDEYPWYISVRDARLLASLKEVCFDSRKMYVEVSSAERPTTADGGCKYEGIKSPGNSKQQVMVSLQPQTTPAIYADITVDYLKQTSEGNGDAPGFMSVWPCPYVPDLPNERGYIHIQDQTRTEFLRPRGEEENNTIVVPKFVLENARILHVHDALSITAIPLSPRTNWRYLEWCRVERCPRVDHVFTHEYELNLQYRLETFWASHLTKARYILEYGYTAIFSNLTCLHVDCCPRLIHVLPLLVTMTYPNGFSKLKTLEIMWCGDLEEALPFVVNLYTEEWRQQLVILEFSSLKHIHLHELPRLRRICGIKMSTLNLETVMVRGCWSLKRLPYISSGSKVVECDCEKEWWDRLEWEDVSQASRYMPIHSRYYKKTKLRGSILR